MGSIIYLPKPTTKTNNLRELHSYSGESDKYAVVLAEETDPEYPLTGGTPAHHVILMGIDGDGEAGGRTGIEFLGSFAKTTVGRDMANLVGEAVALALFHVECDLDEGAH